MILVSISRLTDSDIERIVWSILVAEALVLVDFGEALGAAGNTCLVASAFNVTLGVLIGCLLRHYDSRLVAVVAFFKRVAEFRGCDFRPIMVFQGSTKTLINYSLVCLGGRSNYN